MGTSSSRQKQILDKLGIAEKTGILNLSDLNLSSKSSAWTKINQDNIKLKLKSLDISGNNIVVLPNEVSEMENLKTLNVSECKLESLPELGNLAKLATLQISKNSVDSSSVRSLPSSIKNMNISFNRLVELPHSMLSLTALVELDLSHNQLLHITGIEHLTALIEINLSYNQLQELPEAMSSCTKLQTILLEHNQIHALSPTTKQQSVPVPIFLQTRLHRLELAGNPLRKYDVQDWQGIEQYRERRKALGDKLFQGGITKIEYNLCGLTD